MNPSFRIVVASDPDHEELVGELYFDDEIVCILTQEQGLEAMELELFPRRDAKPWALRLLDFEEGLAALKRRMFELRREPQP